MVQNNRPGEEIDLKSKLRVVPGFPRPGVNFIDITTLLKDPAALKSAIDRMTSEFSKRTVDVLVGIEARGFMIGAPVAYNLGVGFVPARKRGKLPATRLAEEYELEYGSEYLEIHSDAIKFGQQVGSVDDLMATGGTAEATARLVEKMGGTVSCLGVLVALDFLKGRKKLMKYDVFSLVHYSE